MGPRRRGDVRLCSFISIRDVADSVHPAPAEHQPRGFRRPGRRDQADRAHDDVGGQCGRLPAALQLAMPRAGMGIPAHGADCGVEQEMAAQVEIVGHRFQVGQYSMR